MKLQSDIKEISTKELLKFYKPQEIFANCTNCPRYDKNWSCPPRTFNVEEFVTLFEKAYLISVEFSLRGFATKEGSIASYYKTRFDINSGLMAAENQRYTTLIAGHCSYCDECTKIENKECPHPDKIRFSLESLGFKVSDIMESCFQTTLQWDGEEHPDSLYIVAAVLTDETINTAELQDITLLKENPTALSHNP